jgi:hypothetical protein
MATSTIPRDVDALDERLDRIERMQRQILQLLERRERPASVLTRADVAVLRRLLPAVVGALGSLPFASRDLVSDESPGIKLVLQGCSVKTIGRLLSRAAGIPIDNWIVERCGAELQVTLWRVLGVSVSHHEKPPPTSGHRV